MVTEVNTENFEEEVLKSDIPVLIDFWSPVCMPCKMLLPVFEELSSEYKGKIKFVKINAQEYVDLANRYNIAGLPAIVLTKKGMEIDRATGFAPEGILKAKIDYMLEKLHLLRAN